MNFISSFAHISIVIISLIYLSSCDKDSDEVNLKIEDSYFKKTHIESNTVAAYMTVTNMGSKEIILSGLDCLESEDAFMHDVIVKPETGMISMTVIDQLKILPKEMVRFLPGGKHIMIVGINTSEDISCLIMDSFKRTFKIKFYSVGKG